MVLMEAMLERIRPPLAYLLLGATLLFAGAIAGFFYGYSVSVMRGLDAATPQQAIGAMQGINATIRNAWFAPAFFGTPILAAASGFLLFWLRQRRAATAMTVAALVYVLGALIPTFAVNVPMNDALAMSPIPADLGEARALWSQYSIRWTGWNHLRTLSSFACLLLVGLALLLSTRGSQPLRVEPDRPHPKTG
jgi:uncharacterized membrane protein